MVRRQKQKAKQKRRLQSKAHRKWTPFVETGTIVSPDGRISKRYHNSRYCVSMREEDGVVLDGNSHRVFSLSICRVDRQHVQDWRDLQKIKNDFFGAESEAVQVFPAESRLVDTANQTWLWVIQGYRIPLGFFARLVCESVPTGVAQRQFAPHVKPDDLVEIGEIEVVGVEKR